MLCLADFLGSRITFTITLSEDAVYYRLSARMVDLPAILITYNL